jgi:two-component system, LytTR family, sensor kinase
MSKNITFGKSYKYLLYHCLYWIANLLFFTIIYWARNDYENFIYILHQNAAFLPGGLIFTYFSVYYLLLNFFLKDKILQYVLLQLLVLALYPLFSNLVVTFYIAPIIENTKIEYRYFYGFLSYGLILLFDIVPLAGVRIVNRMRQEATLRQKTDLDKLDAELKLRETQIKLLKSQIQPHFLFNTLNNIYSLSIAKSNRTSNLILELASLLSYIIYDCNAEKVPLEMEIAFLNNYINLEKLRYDNSLHISTSINGDFKDAYIAPMILHTFVENSFKHGASKDPENPYIDISITYIDNWLFFSVINSKTNDYETSNSGIGIENAKQRLQLIYPNQHSLNIVNNIHTFYVLLEIQL